MNLLAERIERRAPSVVGVISTREMLQRACGVITPAICDIVEFRADLFGLDLDWKPVAKQLAQKGIGGFVTIRWAAEGGKYPADDRRRVEMLKEAALASDGVDIECASEHATELAEFCQSNRRVCIASFHDFKATPPAETLRRVIENAPKAATVVKLSCMAHNEQDLARLQSLLAEYPQKRLCIIGMGPFGTQTRISFAVAGSVLTYGYLDDVAAPGQLPAAALVQALTELAPNYRTQ